MLYKIHLCYNKCLELKLNLVFLQQTAIQNCNDFQAQYLLPHLQRTLNRLSSPFCSVHSSNAPQSFNLESFSIGVGHGANKLLYQT